MAAELKIGIGAETRDLAQGLKNAEAQISAFVNKVGNIGKIGEQLSSIGQKMSVGLTLPILALGGSAIKAYGDIQSLQKGLEAVMGSAGSASREFERLKEVAKLPGLGMEEAVRGSINLQAIGMDADKSRKILSQFGNAVASVGKGKAEFERAIYGVQQLANTDFPLGEDLNIIKDALPQVSNLLKEAFGTSRSDELAKMGVSSKQVLDTITAGLEKLPRVTGGINGAFENLGDSMKTSLARIGKVIDDTFDISGIIDKLTGYLDSAISYFEGLSPAIQKAILVVGGLVAAAGPLIAAVGAFLAMLPTMLTGIGAITTAFTVLTGPIGLVTIGIIGIVTAVVANWGKIKPYIESTINGLIDLYNESKVVRLAVQSIGFAFNTAFSVVGKILTGVWQSFKTFGKGILELFAGIGTAIKGALTGDFDGIKAGFTRGFAAINSTVIGFGNNFKGTLNEIGNAFTENEKKWSNMGKKSHIKLQTTVDATDVENKTDEAVTQGVQQGVKKTNAKKNIVKIELPDIEPIIGTMNSNFIDAFGNEVANAWNVDDSTNLLGEKIKATIDATSAALNAGREILAIDIEAVNAEFSKILNEGVINGIVGAAEAMGSALAGGGNVVQAAGAALLSTLGGIMVELGKTAIMAGLGIEAIKTALKSLNPGVAIAAGIALVALGGFLKAKVSGIGSSMGSGGGSASGSAGSGSQSYSSSFSSGGGSGGEVVFRISGNDLVGVLSRQQDKNTRIGG